MRNAGVAILAIIGLACGSKSPPPPLSNTSTTPSTVAPAASSCCCDSDDGTSATRDDAKCDLGGGTCAYAGGCEADPDRDIVARFETYVSRACECKEMDCMMRLSESFTKAASARSRTGSRPVVDKEFKRLSDRLTLCARNIAPAASTP
jgi:hypothetical protein